jgi:hypothetical protein
MNTAEKEWDQLDTRLERYDQNSEQMLLLNSPADMSGLGPDMSGFGGYIR